MEDIKISYSISSKLGQIKFIRIEEITDDLLLNDLSNSLLRFERKLYLEAAKNLLNKIVEEKNLSKIDINIK